MLQFLEANGEEPPTRASAEICRKTDLQMACLHAVVPDWNDQQVLQALNKGFLCEHPDIYEELYIEPQMMSEVLVPTEAKAVETYSAALSQVKAAKAHMQQTHKRQAAKYFHRAPDPKWLPREKKKPHWLPARDELTSAKVGEWIRKHTPRTVDIAVDDYNGRFRVLGSSGAWKSISWSTRGWRAAAFLCLHWAWTFHTDTAGVAPPFNLDDLAAEFATEVDATA